MVIMSFHDRTDILDKKQDGITISFIYDSRFQSILMVFARLSLCFKPKYWLFGQGFVFFVVMIVVAFDTA